MSSRKASTQKRARPIGGNEGANDTNAAGDTTNNVRVCIRVRPMNSAEHGNQSSKNIVRVLNENILIFDPKEQESPSYFRGRRQRRNIMTKKNRDMQFAFDHVFDANTPQHSVYEHTTKSIIDSLMNGYNCSVFAYGATGAGKTFTMLGAPGHPGITFLTMMDLYKRIDEIKEDKVCEVRVSYLEVYNENIRDLLVPSGFLAVREDANKGVVVSGLSLQQPQSAEELLRMLEYGNQNRTQHPTDANAQSSRSHAVFQVFVKQKDRTANLSADFRIAKMSLIDLAGSERATVTTNRGTRFREGANINRSLLALGNCINALADKRNKNMHIPYRNSKLTRLLKDSLGGNCKTVMIAAISPSSLTYEDTYNTLKYANRAKDIKSNLKRNVVSVDFHVSRYQQIVAELRTEVSELKVKLQGYELGEIHPSKRRSIEAVSPDEIERLQGELHNVFVQRSSIRKELMELESSDRDLTMKIMRKQVTLERVQLIYGQTIQADKTMSKSERVIAASKARQGRLRGRKSDVEQRMKDNSDWLSRVEAEMRSTANGDGGGQIAEMFQDAVRTRHLEIELKDSRRQIRHIKKVARQQDSQINISEKLVLSLLSVVRKQYFLIKGAGMATSETDAQFESIQKAVEGDREVVWADQSVVSESDFETAEGVDTTDLKSLIELPILSCVNVTPRAPHLKRRDRQRNTPAKDQVVNQPLSLQPCTSNLNPISVKEENKANQNCSDRIQAMPASGQAKRVLHAAPVPVTPCRQAPSTPHMTMSSVRTQNIGAPQRVEPVHIGPPVRTPGHLGPTPTRVIVEHEKQNGCHPGGPPVRTQSHLGPTPNRVSAEHEKQNGRHPAVAKQQLQSQAIMPTNTNTNVDTTIENTFKNLNITSDDFTVEGVAPLKSPLTHNASVVSDSSLNAGRELNKTFPVENGIDTKQPVARSISFEDRGQALGGSGEFKLSPVTGGNMSYAEVVSTPTRAATPDLRRKPLTALTNSPQLASGPQRVPSLNESYTITPSADSRQKNTGYRQKTNQPSRGIKRRDTFTKQRPQSHQRSKSYSNLQTGVKGQQHQNRGSGGGNGSRSVNTLHKYDLPSMMDRSQGGPATGFRKPQPAYMSMTASAANKRTNNNRRQFGSSKENDDQSGGRGGFGPMRNGPGRVQTARRETLLYRPAVRTAFDDSRRMSLSASSLHRR